MSKSQQGTKKQTKNRQVSKKWKLNCWLSWQKSLESMQINDMFHILFQHVSNFKIVKSKSNKITISSWSVNGFEAFKKQKNSWNTQFNSSVPMTFNSSFSVGKLPKRQKTWWWYGSRAAALKITGKLTVIAVQTQTFFFSPLDKTS